MSLNLGLENLQSNVSGASMKFDLVAMLQAEDELDFAMEEYRDATSNLKNLKMVIETLHKHGSYSGFESLIADTKELNAILGFDICSADATSIESMASSELLRGILHGAVQKAAAAYDRLYYKIQNFIKTTLPFKEKYLKEMSEAKKTIAGKTFDEATFQNQTVSSALTKEKFENLVKERKQIYNTILAACKEFSVINVEKLKKAKGNDTLRTWYDKRIAWRPILSWFKSAKVSDLGFKTSDVAGVLDIVIGEIRGLAELNAWAYKAGMQCKKLETEISQLYATGDNEKADEQRETLSRAGWNFLDLWEAALTYERLVRREMYFATYLSRALLKSAK